MLCVIDIEKERNRKRKEIDSHCCPVLILGPKILKHFLSGSIKTLASITRKSTSSTW